MIEKNWSRHRGAADLSLLSRNESYGYAIIQEVKAVPAGNCNGPTACFTRCCTGWNTGLDQVALGRERDRTEAEILLAQKEGKTAMAKHHEQWSLVHSVLAGLHGLEKAAAKQGQTVAS